MRTTMKRFEHVWRSAFSIVLALLLCAWMLPGGMRQAYALTSSDSGVLSWNGVKQGDSYVFTIEANGSVNNAGSKTFSIVYSNGAQGNNNAFQTTWDCSEVKGGWYQNIDGASIETAGSTVTISVPASYFANDDFTVSFGGSSITSAEMSGGSSVVEPTPTPGSGAGGESGSTDASGGNESAGGSESGGSSAGSGFGSDNSGEASSGEGGGTSGTYHGIVIDGDFSDWDAVTKYDVKDVDQNGNPKGYDTVDEIAMVWDGDWVYLYFCDYGTKADWDPSVRQGNWNSVCGAGPHGNGQFAITTDLGNQTLIQLDGSSGEPKVNGVDGAMVAVNNKEYYGAPHKWEVAIPASKLGNYTESISFGMYQVAPTITGVTDLQGSKGGEFNGIVYDGNYDDWKYYPHTTIQYATSGTSEHVVDSKGALYADSAQQKLFGHASTSMPEHLSERGGEFTSAVSIRINDDDELMLTPRFAAVDADGNINWSPQLSGLGDGTYEFYLFSSTCWGNSQNINNLNSSDVCYGKATVTIKDGQQDMEWYMDIPTLAANLHADGGQDKNTTSIDPSDIKKFETQYGRLGQQWVTTAGTSTAPFIGIGLCLAAVAGAYAYRRRKRRAAAAPATTQAESL